MLKIHKKQLPPSIRIQHYLRCMLLRETAVQPFRQQNKQKGTFVKIVLLTLSLVGFASGLDVAAQDVATKPTTTGSFEGRWETTFGNMQLKLNGKFLEGKYPGGDLRGAVTDNTFAFFYKDQSENGQAKFELSPDGKRFTGRYKPSGANQWAKWNGTRAKPRGFQGLWDTSYGKLRLNVVGSEVTGAYNFQGTEATVAGQIKNGRLVFRYTEPDVQGSAWFEVSPDDETVSGKYRPDGGKEWLPWEGERADGELGEKWLVILEANWEGSLEEKQYAFADMLRQYFTMSVAQHVNVRTRSFHDSADLKRFCREVKYLPGPVVLLLSTHGTKDGLTVFNETITPEKLTEGLSHTSNLELIHLSGCSMMAGDFPKKVQSLMGTSACPVSGYKTDVAWDASAIADFTFLSMLLIHQLEPARAVEQAIRLSPYLGDKRVPRAIYRPLGLSIQKAAEQ